MYITCAVLVFYLLAGYLHNVFTYLLRGNTIKGNTTQPFQNPQTKVTVGKCIFSLLVGSTLNSEKLFYTRSEHQENPLSNWAMETTSASVNNNLVFNGVQ